MCIARTWQAFLMQIEIIVHIGKHTLCSIVQAYCLIIERWPHNRHQIEDDIVGKKEAKITKTVR